ncbi:unnamed protein product [Malus baccata var. baccata]
MAMASDPDSSSFGPSILYYRGPEMVQDFAKIKLHEIKDNILSRRNKIFLHTEEVRSLENLKQYYAVCYSIIARFILFGTSYKDFIVNMHLPLHLTVGVISALMVVEINNVKQQDTGTLVLTEPISAVNGRRQRRSGKQKENSCMCMVMVLQPKAHEPKIALTR